MLLVAFQQEETWGEKEIEKEIEIEGEREEYLPNVRKKKKKKKDNTKEIKTSHLKLKNIKKKTM
uniref:Uncharacterized protein n=1 Tax=Pristionchus pacificus TaxID=54126 RepID=A0A2A6BW83_PRIPA|eukprot:PDM70159.1 hypothetical protein PRIPAC_45106 [Pristionchus pacificus]